MSEGKLTDQQINNIFAACDSDGNNVLSTAELILFLRRCRLNVQAQQVREVLKNMGKGNECMVLTQQEFQQLFKTLFPQKCVCSSLCDHIHQIEQIEETEILKRSQKLISNTQNQKEVTVSKRNSIHKQDRILPENEIEEVFKQICKPNCNTATVAQLILYLVQKGYKVDHGKFFEQLKKYKLEKETDIIKLEIFTQFYKRFYNSKVKR